jgi:hypothetical protein
MAKSDDSDILLSTLAEIKKGSDEDPEPRAAAPQPVEAPAPKPTVSSGLLGSLLDEVKAEADREIMEITRTLEEKTAAVKREKEEEEEKKKEQYDKLIQEEAKRRLGMIQKKEDERDRKVHDAALQVARQKQAALQLVKQKKQRKVLLVSTAVLGVAAVTVAVLIATNVIPLLEQPVQETAAPAEENVAEAPANKEGPVRRPGESDYKGPPILEQAELAMVGFEGPATQVLSVPERTPLERFAFPGQLYPQPEETEASSDAMRKRLAKAFARRGGGSSSSSGGSSTSGGITIDTSVFKD